MPRSVSQRKRSSWVRKDQGCEKLNCSGRWLVPFLLQLSNLSPTIAMAQPHPCLTLVAKVLWCLLGIHLIWGKAAKRFVLAQTTGDSICPLASPYVNSYPVFVSKFLRKEGLIPYSRVGDWVCAYVG